MMVMMQRSFDIQIDVILTQFQKQYSFYDSFE